MTLFDVATVGAMPSRLALVVLALLLAACAGGSEPTDTADAAELEGEALVEALRTGGLVLYLRHTETTSGGVDAYETLGDCAAQRELSEAGRVDAREIGVAFDELDVPLDRVVASPFCRTVETAELAFGATETDEALLALPTMEGVSEEARDRVAAAGRELIATPPAGEGNVVLVGQLGNVSPITGTSMDEGGTAVFRPDGGGSFDLVAQVPPQGWQALAAG